MPAHEQLDRPAHEQLDTPAYAQLNTPAHAQLDTPAPAQLDTPTNEQLDTPASAQLDTPAHEQLDTPTHGQLDTPFVRYLWKLNFTFIVYKLQSLELGEFRILTEGFWITRQVIVTYLVFLDHTWYSLTLNIMQEIYSDFTIIRHNLSAYMSPNIMRINWHMKVVRLSAICLPPLLPGNIPGTHFC
jgi:hypothetical protein